MLSLMPVLEDYVVAHSTDEPDLLARLREETQRDLAMPQMQVGPIEGNFLRLMVMLTGARRVLEIGCYSGYSGLCMAAALPEDGKLITCDINPEVTAVARRYFDESGHGHKIEIKLQPALDTIAELSRAGEQIDLVFIDADKENYSAYWDAVMPLVPPGGCIIADNTLWSGRVLAPQHDSDRAIVAFNERVRRDERVDHVLLAVRDGIMLARKKVV